MIQVLSALLTPLIAVLAAYIACQQWRTNHLRLRHELFDRRYALYEKIASFMAEILVQGKVPANAETQFLRDTKATIFLFDKEIWEFTEQIYHKAVALHALEMMLENLQGKDRADNVAKQREIKDWLGSQLQDCTTRFSRFLSLGERLTMSRSQKKLLCGFTIFACLLLACIVGVSAFAVFQGVASAQGDIFDDIVFRDHLKWLLPLLTILFGLLLTGIAGFVGFWFILRNKS